MGSNKQIVMHKLRGNAQFLFDLHIMFPKTVAAIYIGLGMAIVALGYWYFNEDVNQRVLRGAELASAGRAYDAVSTADSLAEDFTEGSLARMQSSIEAGKVVSSFTAVADTVEGKRLSLVLTYYLDAVRALPVIDQQCAHLKLTAHAVEDAYQAHDSTVTDTGLLRAEIAYQACESARGRVQAETLACSAEALSYIAPSRQPPIDTCIYRHDSNPVVRRY